MKKFLPFVTFALAAMAVSAQETAPPKEGAAAAQQRQFAGEVVTADVATKTLTVKATGLDANGQRVEYLPDGQGQIVGIFVQHAPNLI